MDGSAIEKLIADINKISSEVDELYFELKMDVDDEDSVFRVCALKALYNYTSIRNLRRLKKYAQDELKGVEERNVK